MEVYVPHGSEVWWVEGRGFRLPTVLSVGVVAEGRARELLEQDFPTFEIVARRAYDPKGRAA